MANRAAHQERTEPPKELHETRSTDGDVREKGTVVGREPSVPERPTALAMNAGTDLEGRSGKPGAAEPPLSATSDVSSVAVEALGTAAGSEPAESLSCALRDLLWVIETNELIPESVSYMKAARAALAKADRGAPVRAAEWQPLESALRKELDYFRECRDAPMTKGNKTEIATIRKTLNVVVCKLEKLLPPCALTGQKEK